MGAALAPSQVPVVLLGETGAGRELCARLVYRLIGLASEREIVMEREPLLKEVEHDSHYGSNTG